MDLNKKLVHRIQIEICWTNPNVLGNYEKATKVVHFAISPNRIE